LVFWWALIRTKRRGYGTAVLCLFVTAVHTGVLGALLVVATRPLYLQQEWAGGAWTLSALEDQRLGGLVMWVPGGVVYLTAALALFALWVVRSGRPADGRDWIVPAE
jgi:putative membrane protein